MGDRINYNFFRFLSSRTRERLKRMGYSSDGCAANICSSLRNRGEHELAETINTEIDNSIAELRLEEARRFAARELHMPVERVTDYIAKNYLHRVC